MTRSIFVSTLSLVCCLGCLSPVGEGDGGTGGGSSTGGGSTTGGGTATGGGAATTCTTGDFCIVGYTIRNTPGGAYFTGLVGDTINGAAAPYVDMSSRPYKGVLVRHDPGPTVTAGTSTVLGASGAYSLGVGVADDFYMVKDSDMTNSSLTHFVAGTGNPVFLSGSTACGGQQFSAGNVSRLDANTLLMGGSYGSVCKIALPSKTTTLLQPEQDDGGNYFATAQVWAAPTGEVFWVNDEGTINQLGAGRVAGPFTDGMSGLGGTSIEDVWAVSGSGNVYQRQSDGGFALHTALGQTAYGMAVTPDGVFVNAFTSIYFRTQFTDGGFQSYLIPGPANASNARTYRMVGGAGFLHLAGDDGNDPSNPDESYFITLQPRTGF